MEKHTYDLGIIGNCAFMAHINGVGNIVWMCWPLFDSSFIFGSLLDSEKGGAFSVLPLAEKFTAVQNYIENTNILCTEITSEEGSYRITDFAPRYLQYDRYFKPLMLIRKIEPLAGTPTIKVECRPVGNYGELKLRPVRGSNHIDYIGSGAQIRLSTNTSINYILENRCFVLNETKYFILTYGAPLEAPIESTAEVFLRNTINYWRTWVKSTSIGNFFQKSVIRSALVLKIHQHEDTGAIIASGTTSLPESPGSGRNWDYRYCWLRDTFFILNAFNNIGHFEELERYFHYITNISVKETERYQPLYSITGNSNLDEKIAKLEGYLGNSPVRIGNHAYTHIQNDIYGQVLVSLLLLYIDRRFIHSERTRSHQLIFNVLRQIEETMNEPDAGIWEFRNKSQYHCYTYLCHWAGSNAALKIAHHLNDEKMIALASRLKFAAAANIELCLDKEKGVYRSAHESPHLDASTLQLITMNYLDPASDLAKSHLRNLEKELRTPEGLFYRYKHMDDFGKPKSTFLICAFWYVEALACVGRTEEAVKEFEKLLKYENNLGLLSEDIDPETGSQWGNFPQCYSHVGLVNAAFRIVKKLDLPNFL